MKTYKEYRAAMDGISSFDPDDVGKFEVSQPIYCPHCNFKVKDAFGMVRHDVVACQAECNLRELARQYEHAKQTVKLFAVLIVLGAIVALIAYALK